MGIRDRLARAAGAVLVATEIVEKDGAVDAREPRIIGELGLCRIVECPLDLAAEGDQLVVLLGLDSKPCLLYTSRCV